MLLHDHARAGDYYLAQYYALTGIPQLPPLFTLSHHQGRWNYNDVGYAQGISDRLDEIEHT